MRNIATLHKPSTPFAAVNRSNLSAALAVVGKVIERKVTVPILAAVRMTIKGTSLSITGTNLDIEVRILIEAADDSTDMDVVLLLEPLMQFIKMASGELVRIMSSEDGERAAVTCGESSMELDAFDPADFPGASGIERKGSTTVKVSPTAFRHALDCVKTAISKEETRYYLNGVFMHPTPEGLKFVATDGHRLHSKQTRLAPKFKAKGVIIPTGVVKLLLACIKPSSYVDDLAITVSESGHQVRFALDDFVISAKMIDGEFPDYGRVIPAADLRTVTFDSEKMIRIIKSAPKNTNAVSLAFFPDSVKVKMINEDTGSTVISPMPATLQGEPIVVGMDRRYIQEMLADASPGGEEVTIKLATEGDPMLFTGSERGFVGVMMPRRV